MKYTYVSVYELSDTGDLVLIHEVPSSYVGVAALAKKGDNTKKVGKEQDAYGNKEQGIQDSARAVDESFYKSLMPGQAGAGALAGAVGGPGSPTSPTVTGQMSPYAAANYGSSVENIANTYNNLRQAGFKALGAKGFGTTPSGFGASMTNTLDKGQAEATTGAFRQGLQDTLSEGMAGANYFAGEQSQYNPTSAYSGASSSFTNADQLAAQGWKNGIGAATGIASMFVPGAGFASLLSKGAQQLPQVVGGAGGGTASAITDMGSPSALGFGNLAKYAKTGPQAYGGGFSGTPPLI